MEKTGRCNVPQSWRWKHLHERGENAAKEQQEDEQEETPPRTWRKRRSGEIYKSRLGNTSTNVEKTLFVYFSVIIF